MKSATAFRYLTLVIPLVWVSIGLTTAEQQVLADVRLVASQAKEQPQHQQKQEPLLRMTEHEKELLDKFVHHESRFKDHYQSHFSKSNYAYNQYRPAYQHGFELGLDARYRKTDWNSIEPEVRRNWDESTMGLWSQYKDAVRYGWEQGVAFERK